MDSLITAAGQALASGDPLGALNLVALRDDPSGLALRGIAMAQLGDLDRARTLLGRATRAFGPREETACARCVLAEAEIALVSRDLLWSEKQLNSAAEVLERRGDRINAAHARYLAVRRLLLIGHLDSAERELAALDPSPLPPGSRAGYELVLAGIAMRRIQAKAARTALDRALDCARVADIASLNAEVETAIRAFDTPVARLTGQCDNRLLLLGEVEDLLASNAFIVDACRNSLRHATHSVSLKGRPLLFALARALGEAWPEDVSRTTLVAKAFRGKEADESHRARLRVEIGRLRAVLRPLANVSATRRGFALKPHHADRLAVLSPPIEGAHADVLALLADGEAWSSSAVALALGTSQRTAQRALEALRESGQVQSYGRGRAHRWLAPAVPGFPTTMLLPAPLPGS